MGAFAVSVRALSRNNITEDNVSNVLCQNWYLLGVKENSSDAHKAAGSWYLFAVLFKISDDPFYFSMRVPSRAKWRNMCLGGCARVLDYICRQN